MSDQPLKDIIIASVVGNNCVTDSRVIKQAESLAYAGAKITVFCKYEKGLNFQEKINGVIYRRLNFNHNIHKFLIKNILLFSKYFLLIDKSCVKYLQIFWFSFLLALMSISFKIVQLLFILIRSENLLSYITTNKFLNNLKNKFYLYILYDFHINTFANEIIKYKPNIIHAHDFEMVPLALYCKEKTGAKAIFDAHEIETSREGYNDKKVINFIKKSVKFYFPMVDGFVTVNNSIRNYYLDKFGNPDVRSVVVYNSPVLSTLVNREIQDLQDVRAKIGISKNKKLLIFTGAISNNRGIPEIVQAIKPIDNVELCIMGPQNDIALKSFNKFIMSIGMKDRVHIIPPVPHWAVTYTISTADIGVIFTKPTSMNHLFSMPNKLFETTLAGVPIIVPDIPEMKKFVETEGVGLVTPSCDVKSLTKTIRIMLDNIIKYKLTNKKLEDIKKRYDWNSQVIKLIKFYKDILK